MKKFYPFLFTLPMAIGIAAPASAQTFTDNVGGPISDNLDTTYYQIMVTGLTSNLSSAFGLEQITLNITHTKDRDLDIYLESPDGTTVELTTDNGGLGQDYTACNFRNDVSTSITVATAPMTGNWKPEGNMVNFNNLQNGNGRWRLRVYDDNNTGSNTGTVVNWSLLFSNNPAANFQFQSSNLPIIVINTNNQTIVDEPKIGVDMGIIYNGVGNRNYMTDPWNHYNGRCGIEFRGSSSQQFPKKPYGVELWDVNGNAIDSSLLGMPAESDWILGPSYSDKTMLHNPLSFYLADKMGRYAPRFVFVELVIDGEYQGVYALTEKIKRDNNRVDISKLLPTDIFGDELTGGYIVKIDKPTGAGNVNFNSQYLSSAGQLIDFLYDYPGELVIMPQQEQYIQAYVDSFETALYNNNFDTVTGYRRYFGLNNAVDYFLINELSRNVDGLRISTYLHKDKYSNGGKLKMGPVWDYDIAWHNANYCDGWKTTGWAYQFNTICGGGWDVPFWWDKLMTDTNFTNRLQCRWTELRSTIFSNAYLDNWIDSMATYLNEGQQRNFTQWPILGQYVWPNPAPYPLTYQEEIDTLKSWIHQRIAWLDANMPGTMNGCNLTSVYDDEKPMPQLIAYPNPASDRIQLLFDVTETSDVTVSLRDISGREMMNTKKMHLTPGPQTIPLEIQSLSAGVYIAQINMGKFTIQQRFIKSN